MKVSRIFLILAVLFLSAAARANTVSYQGILTNSAGDSLLNGNYNFIFGIFPTPTGGTALWTETHPNVAVSDGIYQVLLGATNALPDSIGNNRWFQITVNGTPLTPRLPITADFRAIEARRAENADSVNHIAASTTAQTGKLYPLGTNAKYPYVVLPNVIASVDSVFNHGGNIDLIAGANISIAPNDSANTITISAAGGTVYQAGRCIALVGNRIDNTMNVLGSECIDVAYDSAQCRYTISLNDGCVDSLLIALSDTIVILFAPDSIFSGEVYAHSFVVTPTGTDSGSHGHWYSDGTLEIYSVPGTGFRLRPTGELEIYHGDTLIAGIDSSGEVFGHSFQVKDDAGNILVHLNPQGAVFGSNDVAQTQIDSTGISTWNQATGNGISVNNSGTIKIFNHGHEIAGVDTSGEMFAHSFQVKDSLGNILVHSDASGVLIGSNEVAQTQIDSTGISTWNQTTGNGISVNNSGTIKIFSHGHEIAGVDTSGEMFAHSFQVKDSAGNIVTHLTNDGQILVNGEPIGGSGEGEIITRSDGGDTTMLSAHGVQSSDAASYSGLTPYALVTGTNDFRNGVNIVNDGTWTAIQNDHTVAGLDINGEIFAKSVMVIDSAGDTLVHLTKAGAIDIGPSTHGVYITKNDISISDSNGHGVTLGSDGTWYVLQNGFPIAGMDESHEMYAHSYQVVDSLGNPVIHLTNDGQILVHGQPIGGGEGAQIVRTANGDTIRIDAHGVQLNDAFSYSLISQAGITIGGNDGQDGMTISPDGSWAAIQSGNVTAGLDGTGEMYAKSFYVKNSAGDTLIHLKSDGTVYTKYQNAQAYFSAVNGFTHSEGNQGVSVNQYGITHGNFDTGNLIELRPNGTITVSRDFVPIAGIDTTGEMIAKSFEVRDSLTGAIKAHLTNSGNLVLPTGAQVTIGGVPIGGGVNPDSIRFISGLNSTLVNATGTVVSGGTVGTTTTTATGINTANGAGTTGVSVNNNGTWTARQGNQVVGGLDSNGELFGKSVYVKNPSNGDTLIHLTSNGHVVADSNIIGRSVIGSNNIYVNNTVGQISNFSELTNGYMRSQIYNGANPQTGWIFYNNGTMQQWIDPVGAPPPMINMQTTTDGYWQFAMPVFFGNPANFNYFSGGTVQQGIITSNNFTVTGKLNALGVIDPIIAEVFTPHPSYKYEPGVVLVADPNSEAVIPCSEAAQTSVLGVVAPDTAYDYLGNVSAVILGAAAPPRDDGSRLEVRVKADAKYGKIKRGDLLTTSPTIGHAMVAKEPKVGTILGKALEPLADGTGMIKVLVTLH